MFRTLTFAAIAAGVVAVSAPVAAVAQVPLGGMITGNDYDRILEIVGAYGPTERRSDDTGNWIRGEFNGTIYSVSFLNCNDAQQNCTTVQFRAWWESNGHHTLASMNQWNRDRRFSSAYLDSRDNATIEFDVNLAGGVTAVNFDDTVQWWQAVLNQFKDTVIDPGFRDEEYTGAAPEPETPPTPSK